MTEYGIWSLLGGDGGKGGPADISRPLPAHSQPNTLQPRETGPPAVLPCPLRRAWLLQLLRSHPLPELPFVCTWLIPHHPLNISLVVAPSGSLSCLFLIAPVSKQGQVPPSVLPGCSAHSSARDPMALRCVSPEGCRPHQHAETPWGQQSILFSFSFLVSHR